MMLGIHVFISSCRKKNCFLQQVEYLKDLFKTLLVRVTCNRYSYTIIYYTQLHTDIRIRYDGHMEYALVEFYALFTFCSSQSHLPHVDLECIRNQINLFDEYAANWIGREFNYMWIYLFWTIKLNRHRSSEEIKIHFNAGRFDGFENTRIHPKIHFRVVK